MTTTTLQADNLTLEHLIDLHGLQWVEEDEQFFNEWQTDLPELTVQEEVLLDQVKAGYLNLRNHPPLLGNTVNTTILSPLLFIGKFYLPPFHLKLEKSIELETPDAETRIRGHIDILLLNQHLWVCVIESKQIAYSVEAGLEQLLAYMLAAPQLQAHRLTVSASGGLTSTNSWVRSWFMSCS